MLPGMPPAPPPGLLALLLCSALHAETAEPASPFAAWDAPPPAGEPPGEPAGVASLPRRRFEAQSKVTVDWIYTVGAGGLGPGDGLRVEDPILHGMRWSKYGATVLEPLDCTAQATGWKDVSYGLVTAHSSGKVSLGLERNTVDAELHDYGYTDLWIEQGALEPGDTLTLRFGDREDRASCGHQVPDRALEDVPWRGWEHIDGDFVLLDPSPSFSVDALREPALLWASAPSILGPDEPARIKVAVLDALGNPIPAPELEVVVEQAYGGVRATMGQDSPGWVDLQLELGGPGIHRIRIEAGELTAVTNPIDVQTVTPQRRLYWGDLHSHHGHTRVLEDGSRVDENHAYGRDVLGWDLGCETMKLPPVEIDGETLWSDLQRACEADSVDDVYLAMLGFEWMGETRGHGHHNVYFDDCGGFLPSHQGTTGLTGSGSLLEAITQAEEQAGFRAVIIPHATPYTGFEWASFDGEHRTAAEVYSGWGGSMVDPAGPGGVEQAIALGHRMGFIASSDNHDGWFGNPLTRLGQPAGVAGLWAPLLERGAVFDALQQRHTVATTGPRIIVDLQAVGDSGLQPAGSELITTLPRLRWALHGTAPIQRLEIRGVSPGENALVHTLHSEQPGSLDHEGDFALVGWRGATWALWLQLEQEDGHLAWSSPIWFTSDCDSEGVTDPDGLCGGDTGEAADKACDGCGSPTTMGWLALPALVLLAARRRREA
jgi:MYXO-CTERM domain-containing protein